MGSDEQKVTIQLLFVSATWAKILHWRLWIYRDLYGQSASDYWCDNFEKAQTIIHRAPLRLVRPPTKVMRSRAVMRSCFELYVLRWNWIDALLPNFKAPTRTRSDPMSICSTTDARSRVTRGNRSTRIASDASMTKTTSARPEQAEHIHHTQDCDLDTVRS